MSKYHTLLVKYSKGDAWEVAFGDYDKEVVQQEKQDSYSDAHSTKIISTGDKQSDIQAEIDKLNK